MTSIVGILCKDGVVIGTDGAVTFVSDQIRTIVQPTEKICIVSNDIIIAGTGSVGLGQRFCAIVEKAKKNYTTTHTLGFTKQLSRLFIQDMQQTFMRPGQYGALVGFPCTNKPCLCEFALTDFQPELKTDKLWYCIMGSAQTITDAFMGFLRRVFWDSGLPNLQEGIFCATWVLEHAIDVNPGGVKGPIGIAILEYNDQGRLAARILEINEIDQHRQDIEEARRSLSEDYRAKHKPELREDLPLIPKPKK